MPLPAGGGARLRLRVPSTNNPVALMCCASTLVPPWCAAEYYDDEPTADLDPTVDILEQEAAKLLQQVGMARGSRWAWHISPGIMQHSCGRHPLAPPKSSCAGCAGFK